MSEFIPRHKKQYGQHFLKEQWVLDEIFKRVKLDQTSSVFEIGGGAGFLTRTILAEQMARLWVFEIDPEWAEYLANHIKDARLKILIQNILDFDFRELETHKPWVLLANLPYQVTFPILYLLQANRDLLKEGVIMVQEEVAQKLLKKSGRDYGYTSLFFQHYFELELLAKIPPTAFVPPPKVYSRLVYFKPRANLIEIPDELNFWKFIKLCFKFPRRTLRNNFASTHYNLNKLTPEILILRAQQLTITELLEIWELIR